MEYYAHSENDKGKKHLLKDHLLDTAVIAEDFGKDEYEKAIFRFAALCHDAGKYSDAFQKYLIEGGTRGRIPHAIFGAIVTKNITKNPALSFAIAGHHKGLSNPADLKQTIKEYSDDTLSLIIERFNSEIEKIPIELLSLINDTKYKEQEFELFIRYLFSALTDADWLDTETHFEPDKSSVRISQTLPIDDLIQKLERELESKSKEGEINQLRNQTLNEVLSKSNLDCGFYSLNLPTGMGKTLTSIFWALRHAKANSLKRIFIVLPYINIIDQTASELKRIFGEELVLEHHSSYNEDISETDANATSVAYRKKLACENWDYPIVVTTTVQFFESLFSNRPSRCRKIHNIANSVVIFDEVQSLPKHIILPTLSMLKNMQRVMRTSFLFCTATQPAFEKRDRFNGIEKIHPLIDNPSVIYEKTRRVTYKFLKELNPVSITDLFDDLKNEKSSVLIICNTKKPVKELFEIAIQTHENWENIYHLSTAMCPLHRKSVISDIRNDLQAGKKIFVSSTQLIEAGVDFDFPNVFREVAPLEAVIQSAGRCNREGKLPDGNVVLFQLEDSKWPDKTYETSANHTKSLLQEDISRIYHYDFFQKYYSQIINLFIDADRNNIIQARKQFNFQTVNDSYHLISEPSKSIFAYNYSDESRSLLHSIEDKEVLSRDDYRRMQQFTVQVYRSFLWQNQEQCKMMSQGFMVWYGNYDLKTGISVKPIDADKLII